MTKPNLGERRACAECNAKFFDLAKRPIVCPKCGFSFDPNTIIRKTSRKATAAADTTDPKLDDDDDDDGDDENDTKKATAEEDDDASSGNEKELSLDDEAPLIPTDDDDIDDGDSSSGTGLPDGYTEEGVEDDSDALRDDVDEDAKLADDDELTSGD